MRNRSLLMRSLPIILPTNKQRKKYEECAEDKEDYEPVIFASDLPILS
jgi:hypothetical protein